MTATFDNPVWRALTGFVLSATGKQLQGLANLPFVTAIWPNTRR
jgi:hypothetical protein